MALQEEANLNGAPLPPEEPEPPGETPEPPGETPPSDPTTPVLESAELVVDLPNPGPGYMLSWSLPPSSLGTPDGGYDIFINGVDTNEEHRTTSLQTEIHGLDTSVDQCFNIQARWTQTGNLPVGNEMCVPPMEPTTPPPEEPEPPGETPPPEEPEPPGETQPPEEPEPPGETPSSETQDNGQDTFLTSGWTGYVHLVEFTDLIPGNTIDAIAIKIENPSGNIRYKVYQDDGAAANPSTLLGQSNSVPAVQGTVYNSLNSPVIVPSSGTVWVGFETDSSSMSVYYGRDETNKRTLHAFGDGPDPYGNTMQTNTYAIWAGIEILGSTSPPTSPPTSTIPDAPTNLAATPVSTSQVDLFWIAPSNDGGESITGYQIEVKVGNGSWSTLVANAGIGTTLFHSGLVSDTTFTYRVSAINSIGTSVPSNEASAITTTTPPAQSSETLDNGQDTRLTSGWKGYVHLVEFTNLTPGNTIDAIAIKIDNPSGNIRYKVYQDDGAAGNPSTLLGQTNSIPVVQGTVYNSLNSPVIVPSSGTVWVGFETDSSDMSAYYGSETNKRTLHAFGDGPDPFGTTLQTNNLAFWAGIEITG